MVAPKILKTIGEEFDPQQLSRIRLPYQVFLATDEENKDVTRAIVVSQITVETLSDWISLAMELPRLLPYTRVFLESSGVCSELRRRLERRMICDEKLMLSVHNVINFNPNQIPILRYVSSELSKVVQCKLLLYVVRNSSHVRT